MSTHDKTPVGAIITDRILTHDERQALEKICNSTGWTWVGADGLVQLWKCNACGHVTRDHLTLSGYLVYDPHYRPEHDLMAVGGNLSTIPVEIDPTLSENAIRIGDVTFTAVKPDMPPLSSQMRNVLIALFDGDKPYNLYVDFFGEEGYKQFESDVKAWQVWLRSKSEH